MIPAWAILTFFTADVVSSYILLRNKSYTVEPSSLIRASYVLLAVFRQETILTYGQGQVDYLPAVFQEENKNGFRVGKLQHIHCSTTTILTNTHTHTRTISTSPSKVPSPLDWQVWLTTRPRTKLNL